MIPDETDAPSRPAYAGFQMGIAWLIGNFCDPVKLGVEALRLVHGLGKIKPRRAVNRPFQSAARDDFSFARNLGYPEFKGFFRNLDDFARLYREDAVLAPNVAERLFARVPYSIIGNNCFAIEAESSMEYESLVIIPRVDRATGSHRRPASAPQQPVISESAPMIDIARRDRWKAFVPASRLFAQIFGFIAWIACAFSLGQPMSAGLQIHKTRNPGSEIRVHFQ